MMMAASAAAVAVAGTAQSMAGRAPRPHRPDPGERRAELSSFPTLQDRTAAGAAPLAASAAAAAIPGRVCGEQAALMQLCGLSAAG
jgi:hypothetical protein